MLLLLASLALSPPAHDSDAPALTQPKRTHLQATAEIALAGIVTDATLSAAGQDFYRNFCAYWHDKPRNDTYAIAVRERLSARRGNQIVVEYAGRVVFHGALPPARGQIRPLSEQAAEIAYETVVNAEMQRLLFSEDELAPDEF